MVYTFSGEKFLKRYNVKKNSSKCTKFTIKAKRRHIKSDIRHAT